MIDQSFSFGAENDARLRKISEDWVSRRYYDNLVEACSLLMDVKDDRESPLTKIAIDFIRQNSLCLGKRPSDAGADKRDLLCSFCGMGPPEVKLGAGPSVFICDKCVDVFHHAL